jgi:hypothetical protein
MISNRDLSQLAAPRGVVLRGKIPGRIHSSHLLIDDVPFVTGGRLVRRGTMACPGDLEPRTVLAPHLGGLAIDGVAASKC